MRLALSVLVVFAGACIEPTLRFCEDAACPVSTTCVNGAAGFACVDDSLLTACDGAADATACTTDDYEGVCRDGICVRPTCGDGLVTAPEACEGDNLGGNTCANVGRYPGTLKCTPACTLDPSECGGRCGDGERNGPEVCEGSDLGGLTCLDLGFYGGTLACSDDCTFDTTSCDGTCGDGMLNGPEACEGANLGGHSCADLNRYRGDVSCNSVCGVNYTDCEGYCGDAVVDIVNGEQCDTTPPTTACMSLGFDTGTVGCSSTCEASTATCGRFGWQYVMTLGPANYVWSDGVYTIAWIGEDVTIINDGVTSTHPIGVDIAGVSGSLVGAAVLHFDGTVERYVRSTGTWTTIAKADAFSSSGGGGGIQLGDDGAIYVADWLCSVFVYPAGDTEWHVKGGPTDIGCYKLGGRSLTDIWARDYHISNWSASLQIGTVDDFEVIAGPMGSVLAATPGGVFSFVPGDSKLLIDGNMKGVERAFERVCGSLRDGRVLCRFGSSVREVALPPGAATATIVDGPDDALSILVSGDLWTTSLAHYERVDTAETRPILGVAVADGAVMIQRDQDHILDLGTGTQIVIDDLPGDIPKGVIAYGDHWLQWGTDTLWEIPRDGSAKVPVTGIDFTATQMWSDGDTFVTTNDAHEVFVIDLETLDTDYSVMTWPADFSLCGPPREVTGHTGATPVIYVRALCNEAGSGTPRSVVFRYDGTWTEYYREVVTTIDAIIVPPGDDRLVLLMPDKVVWMDNGAVVLTQPQTKRLGYRLAASSATDLYAYGESDDFVRPVIVRWDGTAWTRLRGPATIDITHAAASAEALVFGGTTVDRLNRFGF